MDLDLAINQNENIIRKLKAELAELERAFQVQRMELQKSQQLISDLLIERIRSLEHRVKDFRRRREMQLNFSRKKPKRI